MYVRLCVHNTGNALVGPSMRSFMRTNETDTPRSAQKIVKMFHFRNLMFLMDRNSHYYMYLENRQQNF